MDKIHIGTKGFGLPIVMWNDTDSHMKARGVAELMTTLPNDVIKVTIPKLENILNDSNHINSFRIVKLTFIDGYVLDYYLSETQILDWIIEEVIVPSTDGTQLESTVNLTFIKSGQQTILVPKTVEKELKKEKESDDLLEKENMMALKELSNDFGLQNFDYMIYHNDLTIYLPEAYGTKPNPYVKGLMSKPNKLPLRLEFRRISSDYDDFNISEEELEEFESEDANDFKKQMFEFKGRTYFLQQIIYMSNKEVIEKAELVKNEKIKHSTEEDIIVIKEQLKIYTPELLLKMLRVDFRRALISYTYINSIYTYMFKFLTIGYDKEHFNELNIISKEFLDIYAKVFIYSFNYPHKTKKTEYYEYGTAHSNKRYLKEYRIYDIENTR